MQSRDGDQEVDRRSMRREGIILVNEIMIEAIDATGARTIRTAGIMTDAMTGDDGEPDRTTR